MTILIYLIFFYLFIHSVCVYTCMDRLNYRQNFLMSHELKEALDAKIGMSDDIGISRYLRNLIKNDIQEKDMLKKILDLIGQVNANNLTTEEMDLIVNTLKAKQAEHKIGFTRIQAEKQRTELLAQYEEDRKNWLIENLTMHSSVDSELPFERTDDDIENCWLRQSNLFPFMREAKHLDERTQYNSCFDKNRSDAELEKIVERFLPNVPVSRDGLDYIYKGIRFNRAGRGELATAHRKTQSRMGIQYRFEFDQDDEQDCRLKAFDI